MEYKVNSLGFITNDKGNEIGTSVSNYVIRHTGPMDGWNGLHLRLWCAFTTGGRDDVHKISIEKHNVQFRIDAESARSLAHAILQELDRNKRRDKTL